MVLNTVREPPGSLSLSVLEPKPTADCNAAMGGATKGCVYGTLNGNTLLQTPHASTYSRPIVGTAIVLAILSLLSVLLIPSIYSTGSFLHTRVHTSSPGTMGQVSRSHKFGQKNLNARIVPRALPPNDPNDPFGVAAAQRLAVQKAQQAQLAAKQAAEAAQLAGKQQAEAAQLRAKQQAEAAQLFGRQSAEAAQQANTAAAEAAQAGAQDYSYQGPQGPEYTGSTKSAQAQAFEVLAAVSVPLSLAWYLGNRVSGALGKGRKEGQSNRFTDLMDRLAGDWDGLLDFTTEAEPLDPSASAAIKLKTQLKSQSYRAYQAAVDNWTVAQGLWQGLEEGYQKNKNMAMFQAKSDIFLLNDVLQQVKKMEIDYAVASFTERKNLNLEAVAIQHDHNLVLMKASLDTINKQYQWSMQSIMQDYEKDIAMMDDTVQAMNRQNARTLSAIQFSISNVEMEQSKLMQAISGQHYMNLDYLRKEHAREMDSIKEKFAADPKMQEEASRVAEEEFQEVVRSIEERQDEDFKTIQTLHARQAMVLCQEFDNYLDTLQGSKGYNEEDNLFLQGNFAPTATELNGSPPMSMKVLEGEIPPGIEGVFIRNGPNPSIDKPKKRYHWFDGHGMLHVVRIKDGNARYTNGLVQTKRLEFEAEFGEEYFPRVGELFGPVGIGKAVLVMQAKYDLLPEGAGGDSLERGPANTHLSMSPDHRLYCLHEASLPFEIQMQENGSFKSVGYTCMDGQLDFPVSAHPKLDPKTKEWIFHGYSNESEFDGVMLKYGVMSPTGKLTSYFPVTCSGASFNHDMVITENYSVLIDQSVRFKPQGIMNNFVFQFDPNCPGRFGIIPRHAQDESDIKWFETDPIVMIHTLNAWEEGPEIVMWAPVARDFDGGLTKEENFFQMSELRFNLETGQMTVETIPSSQHLNVEFPRMNEDHLGSFSRYGYAAITDKKDGNFVGLAKWDLAEKMLVGTIYHGEGRVGGEPVYVNPSMDQDTQKTWPEDAGYLGMFVWDSNSKESEYVLYDAESFASEPATRLLAPKRVPFGFHGVWLQEGDLKAHFKAQGQQD